MFTLMHKSTLRFVIIQIVFIVCLACSSKDPVEPDKNPGPTCIAASDSIVGWWPLDQLGSGAEELVEGNQGDYTSNPSAVEGKVGGALGFDGVNDLITVPDPGADWILDIAGDITIETWIKRNSDQGGQQVVVGKYYSYYIGCRNGHIFSLISNVFDFAGGTPVPVGEWFHIAVNYDVDDRAARIYINGEVDSTFTTGGASLLVGNGYIHIGGLPEQQYFDGVIDEVSIYNTALSTSEIREIYRRGSLGKCKQ